MNLFYLKCNQVYLVIQPMYGVHFYKGKQFVSNEWSTCNVLQMLNFSN